MLSFVPEARLAPCLRRIFSLSAPFFSRGALLCTGLSVSLVDGVCCDTLCTRVFLSVSVLLRLGMRQHVLVLVSVDWDQLPSAWLLDVLLTSMLRADCLYIRKFEAALWVTLFSLLHFYTRGHLFSELNACSSALPPDSGELRFDFVSVAHMYLGLILLSWDVGLIHANLLLKRLSGL